MLAYQDLPVRVFVALFDYDPVSMSPNPDAGEEELPFREGQVLKVTRCPCPPFSLLPSTGGTIAMPGREHNF